MRAAAARKGRHDSASGPISFEAGRAARASTSREDLVPSRGRDAHDIGKAERRLRRLRGRHGGPHAEIEALRADGHIEEADAELARLEAAWPGWIEKNHPQNR